LHSSSYPNPFHCCPTFLRSFCVPCLARKITLHCASQWSDIHHSAVAVSSGPHGNKLLHRALSHNLVPVLQAEPIHSIIQNGMVLTIRMPGETQHVYSYTLLSSGLCCRSTSTAQCNFGLSSDLTLPDACKLHASSFHAIPTRLSLTPLSFAGYSLTGLGSANLFTHACDRLYVPTRNCFDFNLLLDVI
jgi:hypothetical protein